MADIFKHDVAADFIFSTVVGRIELHPTKPDACIAIEAMSLQQIKAERQALWRRLDELHGTRKPATATHHHSNEELNHER